MADYNYTWLERNVYLVHGKQNRPDANALGASLGEEDPMVIIWRDLDARGEDISNLAYLNLGRTLLSTDAAMIAFIDANKDVFVTASGAVKSHATEALKDRPVVHVHLLSLQVAQLKRKSICLASKLHSCKKARFVSKQVKMNNRDIWDQYSNEYAGGH